MSPVTAASMLVQMRQMKRQMNLLIQNRFLVWKKSHRWYQCEGVRGGEMFLFCMWTKAQWIISITRWWWCTFCPSSNSGECYTAAAEVSFESAGQGNFHPKDSKKSLQVLIFCKSGNPGRTSRSACYLSSSFESAVQPFQPRLQNSCAITVTGTRPAP